MPETDIKQNDDNIEDSKHAFFRGSLDHVYSLYQSRARETGNAVLEIEDFWDRFGHCFPGTGRIYGRHWPCRESVDLRRYDLAINVRLKSTDTALTGKIDPLGWFTGEGESAVLDAFIQAQDTLQNDGIKDYCVVGTLAGSVSELQSSYQEKARKMGKRVLEREDFWNRFRRRFPGSAQGIAVYEGGYGDIGSGPAVFVHLRTTDTALASLIGQGAWFECDAVLDAFIREQDTYSGEPHPEGSRESDPDYDDQILF